MLFICVIDMETKTELSKRIDVSERERISLRDMQRMVHIYSFKQDRENSLLFDVVLPEGSQIVNGSVFRGVQGRCVCLGTVRECIDKYGGGCK